MTIYQLNSIKELLRLTDDHGWSQKTNRAAMAAAPAIRELMQTDKQSMDSLKALDTQYSKALAALREDNKRMKEALDLAYVENQNLQCSKTISPKMGWDALNRQTRILLEAKKPIGHK